MGYIDEAATQAMCQAIKDTGRYMPDVYTITDTQTGALNWSPTIPEYHKTIVLNTTRTISWKWVVDTKDLGKVANIIINNTGSSPITLQANTLGASSGGTILAGQNANFSILANSTVATQMIITTPKAVIMDPYTLTDNTPEPLYVVVNNSTYKPASMVTEADEVTCILIAGEDDLSPALNATTPSSGSGTTAQAPTVHLGVSPYFYMDNSNDLVDNMSGANIVDEATMLSFADGACCRVDNRPSTAPAFFNPPVSLAGVHAYGDPPSTPSAAYNGSVALKYANVARPVNCSSAGADPLDTTLGNGIYPAIWAAHMHRAGERGGLPLYYLPDVYEGTVIGMMMERIMVTLRVLRANGQVMDSSNMIDPDQLPSSFSMWLAAEQPPAPGDIFTNAYTMRFGPATYTLTTTPSNTEPDNIVVWPVWSTRIELESEY